VRGLPSAANPEKEEAGLLCGAAGRWARVAREGSGGGDSPEGVKDVGGKVAQEAADVVTNWEGMRGEERRWSARPRRSMSAVIPR